MTGPTMGRGRGGGGRNFIELIVENVIFCSCFCDLSLDLFQPSMFMISKISVKELTISGKTHLNGQCANKSFIWPFIVNVQSVKKFLRYLPPCP